MEGRWGTKKHCGRTDAVAGMFLARQMWEGRWGWCRAVLRPPAPDRGEGVGGQGGTRGAKVKSVMSCLGTSQHTIHQLPIKLPFTFSISSIQAWRSRPKSMKVHWMPSLLYSSCSSTNMWWLKNCCSFSLVKLMHNCSKPLNWKVVTGTRIRSS